MHTVHGEGWLHKEEVLVLGFFRPISKRIQKRTFGNISNDNVKFVPYDHTHRCILVDSMRGRLRGYPYNLSAHLDSCEVKPGIINKPMPTCRLVSRFPRIGGLCRKTVYDFLD